MAYAGRDCAEHSLIGTTAGSPVARELAPARLRSRRRICLKWNFS